jgi:hypothetical protein
MKKWDLSSGPAKLEMSLKSLEAASVSLSESWNDETHRRFAETYVVGPQAPLKVLLDSIHRLADVLNTAERQCRDE